MQHQVPNLFYIFALFTLLYFIYNIRRLFLFSVGKEVTSKISIHLQIINFLSFGIGQRKVYSRRFTYASLMHFLLGWGFIELFFATTVDFFVARGWFVSYLPEFDTPWFAFLNETGGIMLSIGILMALNRRHILKPNQLPQNNYSGRGNLLGDSGILLFLLFLCIGGFITEAARLSIQEPATAHYSYVGYAISLLMSQSSWQYLKPFLWWSHAITSLLFIALIPLTKMFHVFASLLNIALTNIADSRLIKPMFIYKNMEDESVTDENFQMGANYITDFSSKQLLESIACTECSRCSTVCPATSTGKDLSPMKIVTDIRHQLYNEKLYKNESKTSIHATISKEELWACTTCGACMEECPVLINHVPTIIDMRRYLVLSEGKPPQQANESLENLNQQGNPWGFPNQDRLKWATDKNLDLPILSSKKEVDVLYWIGCAGSFDPRNQNISLSMIKILEAAKIDYAVLGKEETCTGDSARRLGEEYLFETLALKNIETLKQYKFNTVITACPHCFHTISNEYPDFGGNYDVVHHSEYIQKLINEKLIDPNNTTLDSATYHDACYLGRHNNIYDAPRNIISNSAPNANLIEMKQNKASGFCCGAGGGNMWHEVDQGERVNLERFKQAKDTGANTIVTACSFCVIMMDDAAKVSNNEHIDIKDLSEIVSEGL